MRRIQIGVFIMWLGFSHLDETYGQWLQTNGPNGAEVHCFAGRGTTLLVGTSGGLFRSNDNGTTWRSAGLEGVEVTAIGLSPSEGETVAFAGTQNGVYRSSENETSWVHVGLSDTPVRSLIVAVNGLGGKTVFVGSWGGIFVSTNNGTDWTPSNIGLTNMNISSLSVMGTTVFAGTNGGGVFRSTNDGGSWISSGLSASYIQGLGVSADGLGETSLFASTFDGVFRTTNNGLQWYASNSGLTNVSTGALYVDGALLFVSTRPFGVFRSTNYGTSWTVFNAGLTSVYVEAFWINGPHVLAGTEAGVLRSTIDGGSWVTTNSGLLGAGVNALLANAGYLFAGSSSNGVFRSTDFGASWTPTNTGLTSPSVYSLASIGNVVFLGAFAGVFLSLANDTVWTPVGLNNSLVRRLVSKGSTLFAAVTQGGYPGVYRSSNYGSSWVGASVGLPIHQVYALTTDGIDLFAGTNGGGVYRSTNDGESWSQINHNLSNLYVYGLVARDHEVFCATLGGVFRYVSGGANWAQANDGLAASVYDFGVSDSNVFAGTSAGVFRWNAIGWTAVNTGLTHTTVKCITKGSEYLFAGTSNASAWKRPLADILSSSNLLHEELPKKLHLRQNYPNPFNPSTRIQFFTTHEAHVSIVLYDILGREIDVLVDDRLAAGEHEVLFDGRQLPSGAYFYRLTDGNSARTGVMVLQK